jgi:hypothetical protein
MTRLLSFAAAALTAATLVAPADSADAASSHRHKHHSARHGQTLSAPVSMPRGHRGQAGGTWNQTARPPWAGPAECYEDLGYGRFESCDAGW